MGAASAAGVYQAAQVVASVLDKVVEQRIDSAMKECADLARSEVLIRRGFKETSQRRRGAGRSSVPIGTESRLR